MTSVVMDIIARDHFSQQFLKAGAEAEGLAKKVSTTGSKIGSAMKVGAAVGVAALVTIATASVELASKFEDSQKRLEAALKGAGSSFDALKGPIAAADKQMEKLGFTNTQTADALANLTVATKNPTKSLSLLGLAADLARFKHIDLAEAATAVGKAMAGNLKPIKALGIDLPVAAGGAVKVTAATKAVAAAQVAYNQALATYQHDSGPKSAELTLRLQIAQDKYTAAQAAYNKLPTAANLDKVRAAVLNLRSAQDKLDQAGNYSKVKAAADKLKEAQQKLNTTQQSGATILKVLSDRLGGQAQSAASTLAGKTEVLKARFEDMGIKLGTVLIPKLILLVNGVSAATDWFQKHSIAAKVLAGILGGLLVTSIIRVTTAWVTANVEFAATPIGAIITAIVALIAGLVLLWVKWNTVWNAIKAHRGIAITIAAILAILLPVTLVIAALFLLLKNWNAVWNAIKTATVAAKNFVVGVWNALVAAFQTTVNAIINVGQTILTWFRLLPGRIMNFVAGLPGMFLNLATRAINSFVTGITNAAVAIWNWARNLAQTIVNFAVGGLSALVDLGGRIISSIVSGLGNAVGSVVSWFRDLPGKILGALGISSPPRWAISAGEWIIKGVLKGAGSAGSHLVKFFGGLAGKAWAGITKIPSFLGKLGSELGGGFIPGGPGSSVPANVIAEHAYAASLFPSLGWSVAGQLDSLISLWNEESGWNPQALNASSGAFGIPQALPASKMSSAGADWQTNPATQIRWGLGYIKDRYGSPAAAWAFETSHTPNWYEQGAWNIPANQLAFLHRGEMVVPSRSADKFRSGVGGITVAPGAITVYAAPGMDAGAVAEQAFAQLRAWVESERRRADKGGRA